MANVVRGYHLLSSLIFEKGYVAMATIDSEVRIAAPVARVFHIARDVEKFPDFMPDVESVKIQERSDDGSHVISAWVGLIPEFQQKIRWIEEDYWNEIDHTCRFHQMTGDYKQYEGVWTFTQENDGTVFHSRITYDVEIPLIGALIKNLIARKMRENTLNVLHAIKSQAEAASIKA